jgi:hypothetical protein
MRHFVSMTLAVVVGWSAASWARAQDDVKAVIDKAIAAHGGKDKLNKIHGTTSKNKGWIDLLGGVNFTTESTLHMPKQFKEKFEANIGGMQISQTVVFNDGKAWLNINGMNLDVPEAALDELKQAGYLLQVSLLRFADDKDFTLTPLGESKVDDKPVVGVKVVHPGMKDVNLYFAKDTGLLLKIERQAMDVMTNQAVTEERHLLEYFDQDGVKVPKKVLVKRDGKKYLEAEVLEVKLLDKVDEAEFAKP